MAIIANASTNIIERFIVFFPFLNLANDYNFGFRNGIALMSLHSGLSIPYFLSPNILCLARSR